MKILQFQFNNLSRTVTRNAQEMNEKIEYEKDNRTDEDNNLKQMINEIAGLESKGNADVNVSVALVSFPFLNPFLCETRNKKK